MRKKSLDHPVRAQQQRLRDGETKRFGGPAVDEQFEVPRLFHRQVARLGALEDLVHVGRRAPELLGEIRPLAYQATGL